MHRVLLIVMLLPSAILPGCERTREPRPELVTWREDVAPLVEETCIGCHQGPDAGGDYRLSSYQEALGNGSDERPNAIAGNPESKLLVHLSGGDHVQHLGGGDATLHAARLELLRRWVVGSRLAYFHSAFHQGGIFNPHEDDFHGRLVEAEGWTMASCRECHGADYQGDEGLGAGACVSCHTATPESCDTCHGTGDGSRMPSLPRKNGAGAHAVHLIGSANFDPAACSDCHPVPEKLVDGKHLDGEVDVHFSGRATARNSTPRFNVATGSCTDVGCHGAGLEGGERTEYRWHAPAEPGTCQSCHGQPPEEVLATGAPHPAIDRCEVCHSPTVAPGQVIANRALHGDGLVQVIPNVVSDCSACHAGPGAPPPFRDAAGRTDHRERTVGAHDAHIHGGFFSDPIPCASCHPTPLAVDDPQHIDGVRQVAIQHSAANAGGLSPKWNATNATCANNGCHGAGLDGGSLQQEPSWIDPPRGFNCGSCHGIPPTTTRSGMPHPPAQTCGGACHGKVIDDQWQWVDRSLHMNGTVEMGGLR